LLVNGLLSILICDLVIILKHVVDVCKVGGEEKTSFTPIELLTANGPDSTSLQVLADYIILGIQNEEQAVGMVTMTVTPDLTRENIGVVWLS
jgi:hypothetical protein